MRTFITGDRTMTAIYPPLTAVEIMRALGAGTTLVTGDQAGVEALVREFADAADIALEIVPSPLTESGKVDHDAKAATVRGIPDTIVVVIHVDPLVSHVTKSIIDAYAAADADADRLRIVTPANV